MGTKVLLTLFLYSILLDASCLKILGKLIPSESGAESAYHVYEIAEGLFTKIVRVVPKDSKRAPWIEKRYSDTAKFVMESIAYNTISEIVAGPKERTTFKLAAVEEQGYQTLVMEDIQGISLDQAMRDSALPVHVKDSLRALYRIKLVALKRLIEEKYPDATFLPTANTELPDIHCIVGKNRMRTELWIKPDQIVVTFDENNPAVFAMTLVDAY